MRKATLPVGCNRVSIARRVIRLIESNPSLALENRTWYDSARAHCADVANAYGVKLEIVCGVIAALSPGANWDLQRDNIFRDMALLRNAADADSVFTKESRYKIMTNNYQNVRKAWRIVHGASPEAVLSGPKVVPFYHNLIGNQDMITKDRHVIAFSLPLTIGDKVRYAATKVGALHTEIDHGIRLAAAILTRKGFCKVTWSPAQTQAAGWAIWRALIESLVVGKPLPT